MRVVSESSVHGTAFRIAIILSLVSEEISSQALSEFFELPLSEISRALDELGENGLLVRGKGGCCSLQSAAAEVYSRQFFSSIDRDREFYDRLDSSEEKNAWGMLGAWKEGSYKKCLQLTEQSYGKFVRNKKILAFSVLYNVFYKMCLQWEPDIQDKELCELYLSVSLKLQIEAQHFPKEHKYALIWFDKLRIFAEKASLYDYVTLIKRSAEYIPEHQYVDDTESKKKEHVISVSYKSVDLSDISDVSLWNYYLPYVCLSHYTKGEFLKSMNCCYNSLVLEKSNLANFNRTLYVYAASSAIFLGEFEVGINILRLAIETARNLHRTMDMGMLHAYMGYIYILLGMKNEFIQSIEEAKKDMHPSVITYAEILTAALPAYSLCREKKYDEAYDSYKSWLMQAVKRGYRPQQFMSMPFILEMMFEWHKRGMPAPHGRDFAEELTEALHSPALPIRGLALRLSGELLAYEKGWDNPEVTLKLEQSLALFRGVSIPIEQAKVQLCLARSYAATGKKEKSILAAREAREVQIRYGMPESAEDHTVFSFAGRDGTSGDGRQMEKTGEAGRHAVALQEKASTAIIYNSEVMRELMKKVEVLAPTNASVLILGESGVGKEGIARRLHALSARPGRFIPVNLASIPETLFESEFFGHEKGSFTGANYRKIGFFELANEGTLFLDEVADVPLHIQVKLLRALQEKNFTRVGGTTLLSSDFRLVTATNKDLAREVKEGRFREDLFYRLDVVTLNVPPLRERREDIFYIARHFLEFYSRQYGCRIPELTEDENTFFTSYSWPGNVRELRNYIERFCLLQDFGHKPLLPHTVEENGENVASVLSSEENVSGLPSSGSWETLLSFLRTHPSMEQLQLAYFEYMYVQKNGVIAGPNGVAEQLGISRGTAHKIVERLNLRRRFCKKLVSRE